MSFEEMVVALVGAVGGIALTGFIVAKITGLIKAWIHRNNSAIHEEDFDRLAKAFMQYKKDTERRLQNLEAIVTSEEPGASEKPAPRIEAPKESIEIEDHDSDKEHPPSQSGDNSNLRNMLRE